MTPDANLREAVAFVENEVQHHDLVARVSNEHDRRESHAQSARHLRTLLSALTRLRGEREVVAWGKPPTAPGHYWFRIPPNAPRIVEVEASDGDGELWFDDQTWAVDEALHADWSGPIPIPAGPPLPNAGTHEGEEE